MPRRAMKQNYSKEVGAFRITLERTESRSMETPNFKAYEMIVWIGNTMVGYHLYERGQDALVAYRQMTTQNKVIKWVNRH